MNEPRQFPMDYHHRSAPTICRTGFMLSCTVGIRILVILVHVWGTCTCWLCFSWMFDINSINVAGFKCWERASMDYRIGLTYWCMLPRARHFWSSITAQTYNLSVYSLFLLLWMLFVCNHLHWAIFIALLRGKKYMLPFGFVYIHFEVNRRLFMGRKSVFLMFEHFLWCAALIGL